MWWVVGGACVSGSASAAGCLTHHPVACSSVNAGTADCYDGMTASIRTGDARRTQGSCVAAVLVRGSGLDDLTCECGGCSEAQRAQRARI